MRFWELDAARGIAVVFMLVFNWSFALSYLNIYTIPLGWAYWFAFPRLIGASFIFIAGIAMAVNAARTTPEARTGKFLHRGLFLLSIGGLITLATFLFAPRGTIYFGILHFMGAATLFGMLFVSRKKLLLPTGLACIVLGIVLQQFTVGFPWLLWLGLAPLFQSFDYFPLLPWFGVFLLGMHAGTRFYPGGRRARHLKTKQFAGRIMATVGRHSLVIYLIHQPLLLLVLFFMGVPIHL